jgi:hypothetical protein
MVLWDGDVDDFLHDDRPTVTESTCSTSGEGYWYLGIYTGQLETYKPDKYYINFVFVNLLIFLYIYLFAISTYFYRSIAW